MGRPSYHGAASKSRNDGKWIQQQARTAGMRAEDEGIDVRLPIHDHDAKFTAAFEEHFQREDGGPVLTPCAAPMANNFAKRMIRPAVILRKNSQGNRSEKGAAVQAVLMSVLRTLKLRGHDPLKVVPHALRTYLKTGTLPPLPDAVAANG